MQNDSLHRKRKLATNTVACLFILPIAFFLVFYIFRSIIYTFQISTLNWNGVSPDKDFIGIGNWQTLLKDVTFRTTIKNNLIVVVTCIVVQIPIGLVLAYLIDWAGKKANFIKSIYFLPLLMSAVAIGFLFKQLFDSRYGIMAVVMKWFMDKPFNLLANETTAIWAVIAVISWQFIPFYMLYFFAGLTTIPEELYEAAVIDGAKRHQYIFRISLPMMSSIIKNASILSLVGSLKYFDLIYVMTEGGPSGTTELMATHMYKTAFTQMRMGYGSTVAAAMFIIITVISLSTFRLLYLKEDT